MFVGCGRGRGLGGSPGQTAGRVHLCQRCCEVRVCHSQECCFLHTYSWPSILSPYTCRGSALEVAVRALQKVPDEDGDYGILIAVAMTFNDL